jgi:hypothetical protein
MSEKKKPDDYTLEEMRTAINSIGPKSEMYVGIAFLRMLLDAEGVAGVVKFMRDGAKILDEDGKILPYELSETH